MQKYMARDDDAAEFLRADASDGGYPEQAFSADVRAGKGTSFYRAHTYHTKVPPQGIEQFIEYYTQPGQVVLDPFCGSGMTGIAAIRQGRRAVLSDLSPAAAFFAHNHCLRVDPDAYARAAAALADAVEKEFGWLYETQTPDGQSVKLEKMLWSETYLCPMCRQEYALWNAALDADRKVKNSYACPHCGKTITKKASKLAGLQPVRVDYRAPKAVEAPVGEHDLALLKKIEELPWPEGLWYPTDPIPADGDEIRRLHRKGITSVDGLFVKRALLVLAALWQKAGRSRTDLRPLLHFTITGTMQRASRLNKFIPSLNIAPGPILGTMYIPGFYPEMNVFKLFRRKARAIAKSHRELWQSPAAKTGRSLVLNRSATDLSPIPDASVDYVFTDPPFGSNIAYSELNLLWESWLGKITEAAEEAVVSNVQQKTVGDYGALMARSFGEIRRVLKEGAWLTLVFHNSSGEVWAAIQDALLAAGLPASSIHTFDKAHDTFKMVTAPGAVGFDVVVNCRKTADATVPKLGVPADIAAARDFLQNLPAEERQQTPRKLHARAIAHFMTLHRPISFDYKEFRLMAEQN